MCFPNSKNEDEEISPTYKQVVISEGIIEHIDSLFLNFDLEDGILAFVYESCYEIRIVYTSPEAKKLCEEYNYFEEEEENPFLDSYELDEENPFLDICEEKEQLPYVDNYEENEELPYIDTFEEDAAN